MIKKLFGALVILVILTLTMSVSCAKSTTQTSTVPTQTKQASTTIKPSVTSTTSISPVTSSVPQTTHATSTSENWWDKFGTPKYGGTIKVHLAGLRLNFDTWDFFPGDWQNMVYESPFTQANWPMDRNVYAYNGDFVPFKYLTGILAESWQMTDPQTMEIKLHQGVLWQNKAPVNGRELVASDVAAHYKRILGPEASPHTLGSLSLLDSVTATDKYTVVFKFKAAGPIAIAQMTNPTPVNTIEAPEYVALGSQPTTTGAGGPPGPGGPPIFGAGSPLQDWHNIVGTGPWIVSDVVADSSMTLIKNPNYWGYDERYPQNKLPYADSVVGIVIKDTATALAAIRTGKIDFMGGVAPGVGISVNWQLAETLVKSNPELIKSELPVSGGGLLFRFDKAPFNDIRVREALNMAIDREIIAKGYYGGTLDPTPAGMISPIYPGYAYPYSEWSQDLKDVYSYNIGKARQLMTEAGYSNGFKTNCLTYTTTDTNLLQVLKAQLMDIGVDMTINAVDMAAWQAVVYRKLLDQMTLGFCAGTSTPSNTIYSYLSTDTNQNFGCLNDPNYDKLFNDYMAASDDDQAAAICQEMDKYVLEQAYGVKLFPNICYVFNQPYLKGYSGESIIWGNWSFYTARWWIDQSISK